MKKLSLITNTLLLATIALTGCGGEEAPKAKVAGTNNVLSHQIEALNKAKDLEKQLNESAEKQRKAIEDMTK
ncbi:MAG TPA: hypothetical protein EYH16_05145 [Leucothrix mucor]|nr:hypothetical protein [Leucothrix mucor]